MSAERVGLEIGKRRVFASFLAWPGWCRSGRDEESAIETLASYRDRYRIVVELAGLELPPPGGEIEVVERVQGDATTDFGAPGKMFACERGPATREQLDRCADLLEAGYRYLGEVVDAAPAVLAKGPRGGGRDTEAVAAHVLSGDFSYARKLGVPSAKAGVATRQEISAHRQAILDVFRRSADGAAVKEKGWPLLYAARRGLWHVLDHAWEIEDKSQ